MGDIVLLDELTINKIAAGEVIERPASVVKELVENSIDAGATNISVEIKNGGISYIRITDNGKGIASDDLEIAFERHSTSKIRQAEDLNIVKSMGFRGEALASIAAISNMELVSKTRESDTGNRIVVEAGNVLEKEETGCPDGTTITVNNLFFNTPVRYKFLKKDYTETGYIEDIITRLALVNKNIAFKLISGGKTIIQTSGDGILKNIVYNIYGNDIANAIIEVEYEYEGIKVVGVVGKPEISRSNRTNQIFFVNGRYVKDKTLLAASEQAYKGIVPLGKFGFSILDVEVDPGTVDVNVHPAKLEVRFTNESEVFKAAHNAIKEGLLKHDLIGNPFKEKEENNVVDNSSIMDNSFEKETIIPSIEKESSEEEISSNTLNMLKQAEQKLSDYREETNNIIEELFLQRQREKENATSEPISQETMKFDANLNTELELGVFEETKKEETSGEDIVSSVMSQMNELREKLGLETSIENKFGDENKTDDSISTLAEEQEEYKQEQVQTDIEESKDEINNAIEESAMEKTAEVSVIDEEPKEEGKADIEVKPDFHERREGYIEEFDEMYSKLFGEAKKLKINKAGITPADDITSEDNLSIFEKDEKGKMKYKFTGIAFSTYIILEIKDELYIMDQHAAHERIIYEKVKRNFYSTTNKDSQMMLLPDIIELTHKELDVVTENVEVFEKAGFVMEEFGENTIKLTGVPEMCMDLDTRQLFLDILDELNTVAKTAKQEIEERFIATVACKAAIKANMAIKKEEVDALLEELLELENPFSCPHGRPTAIKLTKYDMEKKFARK